MPGLSEGNTYVLRRQVDIMANILLVDDEPEIVFLTKMMLEKVGHEVTVASDSAECLEKLKPETHGLILLDIMMPGDDGWEACKKIKEDEKTRDIPVAMFTVRTSDASVEKSFKYSHADDHINKPFDREELLDRVERLLGKATPEET
jgi:two-component system sensor histidine kinase/response regulator